MEKEKSTVDCYKCDKDTALNNEQKISRQEECQHCFASLHCCKMCGFYDMSSYNECREPSANRILDKEKPNFCDYFKLQGKSGNGPQSKDIFSAADSLFKD